MPYQRPECLVLCDCDPSNRIQRAAVEYYCPTCRNNMFEEVEQDVFVCMVNPSHKLVRSGRCLNKAPIVKKSPDERHCNRQTAAGDCTMLHDVRKCLPGEGCPICGDAEPEFVCQWDCRHILCTNCVVEYTPTQQLFAKNRQGNWVPSCMQCKVQAAPREGEEPAMPVGQHGSTDLSTFKLLPRPQYEAIKDRGVELALAEVKDGVVCPQCNGINDNVREAQQFNCAGCGTLLCGICRAPKARCMHSVDDAALLENFDKYFRRNMWIPCPRCGEGALKDDKCSHVTCLRCNLRFCYACGRSRDDVPGLRSPLCSSHPTFTWLSRILAEEIQQWQAAAWEHVFFSVRAFVVVNKFAEQLTDVQLEKLRSTPCPVVSILETAGVQFEQPFRPGESVDRTLQLSQLGWNAFLGRTTAAERLEIAARRHFAEWFTDVSVAAS